MKYTYIRQKFSFSPLYFWVHFFGCPCFYDTTFSLETTILKYSQTRCFWWTKVCYDPFNNLGSYRKFRKSSKFLANNFALADPEDNINRLLNRGSIADLPCGEHYFTKKAKFLGSDGIFCISICKFGTFTNPFATITSLSELNFRFRRFIMLVQTKKVISINYGICTST